jgi:hypothetical protein
MAAGSMLGFSFLVAATTRVTSVVDQRHVYVGLEDALQHALHPVFQQTHELLVELLRLRPHVGEGVVRAGLFAAPPRQRPLSTAPSAWSVEIREDAGPRIGGHEFAKAPTSPWES